MAEVLTDFVFKGSKKGGTALDRFMDGQVWRVTTSDVRSRDARTLLALIYERARRLGLKARCQTIDDATVVMQVYREDRSPVIRRDRTRETVGVEG